MPNENIETQFNQLVASLEEESQDDVIGMPSTWVLAAYLILGPTAALSGLFSNQLLIHLFFPILAAVGALMMIGLRPPHLTWFNREPFAWVTRHQQRLHPTVTKGTTQDAENLNQLSPYEITTWEEFLRELRQKDEND